jgi:hypothetical protein
MEDQFLWKVVFLERVYTFEEVKQIIFQAKGHRANFDESIDDWLFHKKSIYFAEVQQHSLWDMSKLATFKDTKHQEEYQHIMQLVHDLKNGTKLPPVILGWKDESGYDIRDGKHRLSALKYLQVKIIQAFVRVE